MLRQSAWKGARGRAPDRAARTPPGYALGQTPPVDSGRRSVAERSPGRWDALARERDRELQTSCRRSSGSNLRLQGSLMATTFDRIRARSAECARRVRERLQHLWAGAPESALRG